MGIMSNVLCRLGAELVVPNVVYQSDRQKRLFPCEGILLPECTVCPSDPSDEPVHFVFEFRKGDSFSFGDEKILTPRENRFIASFDEINPNMEISPGFSVYAADHLAVMDGAIISGFHMLQPSYPDGSKFETKAEPVFRQVREWKREKPSLPVHAELGHFVSVNIAEFVFRSLAGIVDSIGMNEDELADLVARIDSPVAGVREMNMGSLLEAAQKCMDVSPDLSTLNIHTRDIVLSVSREKQQVLSCIDSLDFGIRTASAFASTGKLESRLFVEQVSGSLERSVHGLKELDDIGHIIGGVRESAGICGMYGGYEVCAVPTLIAENPAVTVGLGDTFSAASFLRYLEYCTADPRINGS
jgi:ADP-dependent phosphofructokinase/glucokinase